MASDDDIVLMQHTVEMYQAIATAQLAIVPGTSHLLLFEKPTLCTGLVAAFLSSDPAPIMPVPFPGRTEVVQRIDLGEVPYPEAIAEMDQWVRQRQDGLIADRLVLLTHPPVITYSARTPPAELPVHGSISLVQADRGGQATYHGPGQLIGYLVMDLHQRGAGDIVRWLENGLVDALQSLGFKAIRRDTPPKSQSLVGVWTPERTKIASIGMRIRRGVTSHGFALNIAPDLTVFSAFTACGLPEVAMTSLAELASNDSRPAPTEAEVRAAVASALDAQ